MPLNTLMLLSRWNQIKTKCPSYALLDSPFCRGGKACTKSSNRKPPAPIVPRILWPSIFSTHPLSIKTTQILLICCPLVLCVSPFF